MSDDENGLIGGPICAGAVAATLIDPEDQFLSGPARDGLWEIFCEIGRKWGNVQNDSAGLKSSWLDFIEAKTKQQPSYVGEYMNALSVVQELVGLYDQEDAFNRLFFDNGIPDGPPTTRLAHAKTYVIDEFIRVQITASGFRGFADSRFSKRRSLNYKGFVRGSRYNERPPARLYDAGEAK